MATATETTATTTPETRPTGMALPCPLCGQAEATVSLNLYDLDTCTCAECSEDFTLDQVREFIAKWGKVLAWVQTFPAE